MLTQIRDLVGWLRQLEAEWGVRPIVKLACAGSADEHWQAFRNLEARIPHSTWTQLHGREDPPRWSSF